MPDFLIKVLTSVKSTLSASTALGLVFGGIAFSIGVFLGWPANSAKLGAVFAIPVVMVVWGITHWRMFSVPGLERRLESVGRTSKALTKSEYTKIRNILIEEFASGRGVSAGQLKISDKIDSVIRDLAKKEIQRLLPKLKEELDNVINTELRAHVDKAIDKEISDNLQPKVSGEFERVCQSLQPKLAIAIRKFVIDKVNEALAHATKNQKNVEFKAKD